MAQRADVVTIPTQLGQSNWFLEGLIVAGVLGGAWQAWTMSYPSVSLALVVLVVLWGATSDAALDVRGVGVLAGFLRSLFGGRRPHEWVYVQVRYHTLKRWPAGRTLRLGGMEMHPRPLTHPAIDPRLLVFRVEPDVNVAWLDPEPRKARMDALAAVLMGLGVNCRLLVQSRPVRPQDFPCWPRRVQIRRSYLVEVDGTAVASEDVVRALGGLGWRVKPLQPTRCQEPSWETQMQLEWDGVRYGPYWSASLVLSRWPRSARVGWVGQALEIDLPCDVVVEIRPDDPDAVARWLQGRVQELSDEEQMSTATNAARRLAHTDADTQREQLLATENKPAHVGVVLTVRARSRDELRERLASVRHRIGIALADAQPCHGEHDLGRAATEVGGRIGVLNGFRKLDCRSAASTYPLFPLTLEHERGALIGVTTECGMAVRLDPFDESIESFGAVLVAKTGAGKSYFLKCLVRALLRLYGYEVIVIEQRRTAEHEELTRRCGGPYVYWDGDAGKLPDGPVVGLNLYPPTKLADGSVRPGLRPEDVEQAIPGLVDWLRSRLRGQPVLLLVDEGWAILKHPMGRAFAEEMARTGRGDYVSFWFATQQIADLLKYAQAVFDNATIRVLLKQRDNDLDEIQRVTHMSGEWRSKLEASKRGVAFIDWNGLVVKMEAQCEPSEHAWMDSDPRNAFAPLDELADESDARGETNAADVAERAPGALAGVGAAAGAAVPPDAPAGREARRAGARRDGAG